MFDYLFCCCCVLTFLFKNTLFVTENCNFFCDVNLFSILTVWLSVQSLYTVQPARNLQKPYDPGGQNYPTRSNTVAEHPLTLVVMTQAYRDDGTRGFAVVAREVSSRSTVFHCLHCTCKLYKIRDRRVRPSGSAVFVHRVARCLLPWAIEHR